MLFVKYFKFLRNIELPQRGAAVKNRKAHAEGIFGYRKRGASGSNPRFVYKKKSGTLLHSGLHFGCPTGKDCETRPVGDSVSNLWRSGQKSQGLCRRDFWAPQEGSFGYKKIRNTFAFRITFWLPHEDSNPDKQSQSLPCYRYTIGQYLTCFTIIFIFCPFVNRKFKIFQNFLQLSTKVFLCIIILM